LLTQDDKLWGHSAAMDVRIVCNRFTTEEDVEHSKECHLFRHSMSWVKC